MLAPQMAREPAFQLSPNGLIKHMGCDDADRNLDAPQDPARLFGAHRARASEARFNRHTNARNGRSARVRVNNSGPYVARRLLDVSHATAELLDFVDLGCRAVAGHGRRGVSQRLRSARAALPMKTTTSARGPSRPFVATHLIVSNWGETGRAAHVRWRAGHDPFAT